MRFHGGEGANGLQLFAVFQGPQGAFCALQYSLRHAGHAGHVDTEAVCGAAFFYFAQEQDFAAHFLHGNVEVLHAGEEAFEVVELVIVGGKERLGTLAVFVDVFDNAAGDGHAVVGGRAAANFVQQHQGTGA